MNRDTGLVDRIKSRRHARSTRTRIPSLLAAALFTASLGAGEINHRANPSDGSAVVTARDILAINEPTVTTYLPTGMTSLNDARPIAGHAAVYPDGVTKYAALGGMPWAAAPGNDAGWNRSAFLAGLDLYTGTYDFSTIDYTNPLMQGAGIVLGRSHVARQITSADTDHVSNGPMGENWVYGQGEVLLFEGATNDLDVMYLLNPGGGTGHIAFARYDASSVEFQATDGARAVAKHTAASGGDPGYYSITWGDGTRSDYFDASEEAGAAVNQWWRNFTTKGDLAEDISAYAGHATDGSLAVSDGYTAEGFPEEIMIDADTTADDLRISYTYTTGTVGGTKRVDIIYVEEAVGAWGAAGDETIIAKIDHDHYTAEVTDRGLAGDLELVTVSTLMSDGAYADDNTLYTYDDTTAYNATNNPYPDHYVRMMIESTGYDSLSNPDTATIADLKEVSSVHLAYDAGLKVTSMFANGQCGCSGAPDGQYAITYEDDDNPPGSPTFNDWVTRTQVIAPDYNSGGDNAYTTTYFNKAGQVLAAVVTDGDPITETTNYWVTDLDRDATTSVIDSVAFPDANSIYTHNTSGNPDGTITRETTDGLVHHYTRKDSATVLEGLMNEFLYSTGNTGTQYLIRSQDYTTRQFDLIDIALTAAYVDETNIYHNTVTPVADGPSNYDSTTRVFTYHSATVTNRLYIVPDKIVTTNPVVTTAQNGSGTATSSSIYLREGGTVAYSQSTEDIYTYTKYTDGQVVEQNIDISSSATVASGDETTNWTGISLPAASVAADRTTTMEYDTNGRSTAVVLPDGRRTETSYLVLNDGRLATISVPRVVTSGTTTYYGPAGYRVSNLAGGTEFTSTLAIAAAGTTTSPTLWIDTNDSNEFEAADYGPGTVFKAVRNVYTANGSQLDETHTYFLNKTAAPWYGTEPTNFDTSAKYEYSVNGKRWRSITAAGTISRTKRDHLDRVVSSWIGTNDNESQFPGGNTTGTSDMVKVSETVYDGGNVGNSLVTKRTAFVDDTTTDKRETSFEYDVRGNLLFTTNALAPHTFNSYDAQGRLIASAQYSAIHASFDPEVNDPVGSATYDKTNRVRANETFYDAMGRVYQSEIHEVIQSTGVLNDSLTSDTWRDKAGRTVCVQGGNFTKHEFDRLGRRTDDHTLSSVNDTDYAGRTGGVSGDTVLETTQTRYESTDSDNVLMTVSLSRYHDNTGTGKLDLNNDADDLKLTATDIVGKARAFIVGTWYDDLDRPVDNVVYGTYTLNDSGGNANFDMNGLAVPTRSDSALRTSYSWDDNGTVKNITDPMGYIARTENDDAGRLTKRTENYTDGTPGGGTGDDDDRVTKFEYTDGHRTKTQADMPGSEDDQDTIYTYGVTKGASAGDSKIGDKDLLHTVQYADSSGGSDVVTYAYNAQNQEIYKKDQNGSVHEYVFDTVGRKLHDRFTMLDADIDPGIRRISTIYATAGTVTSVTQYNNATVDSGTIVNSVTNTYNDWLMTSKQEQDHDSAAGGTLNYDVEYAFEKATGGRKTVRLDTLTYPDGTVVGYEYGAAGSIEDDFSRVDQIKIGATAVVNYEYKGATDAVSWDYLEPDARWRMHAGASSVSADPYSDLSVFDQVTSNRWNGYKGSGVDFVDSDFSYNRNANVKDITDNIFDGHDVLYTMDELNRVTAADEGTLSGGSISSRARKENWTISQWGNWSVHQDDLNGDGDFVDTDELDEYNPLTGTPLFFNAGNEWLRRDTDNDGTVEETLTYDANGSLATHQSRIYTWDGLNRLVKIEADNDPATLIIEYMYDSVGRMIGMHYDTTRSGGGDPDGTTDSNDPWFRFIYDGDRLIATYRDSDALANPKEHFYSNKAGLDGAGGGSYINDIFKRERDHNTNWYDASDGTLERGDYLFRNWRGDTAAVLTDGGNSVEFDRYSSYGTVKGIPAGDCDNDGDVDNADAVIIFGWKNASTQDARGDLDLDGDVDGADLTLWTPLNGNTLGRGNLSLVSIRSGYAGYQIDPAISTMYHVRARKFSTELGRFLSRDPSGFRDSLSLYEYVGSNPILGTDPMGLGWWCKAECVFRMAIALAAYAILLATITLCITNPAACLGIPLAACTVLTTFLAALNYCASCNGDQFLSPGVAKAVDILSLLCGFTGKIFKLIKDIKKILTPMVGIEMGRVVTSGRSLVMEGLRAAAPGIEILTANYGYVNLTREESYEQSWRLRSLRSGLQSVDSATIGRCLSCG